MELDDAYDNLNHIPDALSYEPRWSSLAAAFRATQNQRARIGVSYGSSPRQRFDLFSPEGTAVGLCVFVHGGYWRRFDSSFWSHLAAGPLAHGWAVAMPSYDLCPDVKIGDITRQIAHAIECIAIQQDGPVVLFGHSAGGHLVSRMLAPGMLSDPVAQRICHVTPISPLADLRPLRNTKMNTDFQLSEAEACAESPVLNTNRLPVRTRVWVGAEERPGFLDQASWQSQAWGCEMEIVPKAHHFDIIDALADPESRMVRTGLRLD